MNSSQVIFIERKFPSSNMILIKDRLPILIDSGFGSDVKETVQLLQDNNVSPEQLYLVVNTHYHSDHVGGNNYLQKDCGVKIAAHKWDANLINARHLESCSAEWLNHSIEPYEIDVKLSDNDEIGTGNSTFQVLHTPGHTLGHICLYEREEETLICGDLLHRNDVGWLNIFREGVSSVQQSLKSLDQVSKLPVKQAYSGHGPKIDDFPRSIEAAKRRLENWITNPEEASWHACKRIFAFTLIMKNGLAKEEIGNYLLNCGWFQDFSRYAFRIEPDAFVQVLLDEMIRSGAASWHRNHLIATVSYNAPQKEWLDKKIKVANW